LFRQQELRVADRAALAADEAASFADMVDHATTSAPIKATARVPIK
jgi:hypothetical protein